MLAFWVIIGIVAFDFFVVGPLLWLGLHSAWSKAVQRLFSRWFFGLLIVAAAMAVAQWV